MSLAIFPATLPSPVVGTRETAVDQRAIFQPEIGAELTRRRTTTAPKHMQISLPAFTVDQLAEWEAFVETTLEGGTLPFSMMDPVRGDTAKFQIKSNNGSLYQVEQRTAERSDVRAIFLRFPQPAEVAPVIIGVPTISATAGAVVGSELTATPAAVTGAPLPTRTWQWLRDGVEIAGADQATYQVVNDDIDAVITVRQIEDNLIGPPVPADSVGFGPIVGASPPEAFLDYVDEVNDIIRVYSPDLDENGFWHWCAVDGADPDPDDDPAGGWLNATIDEGVEAQSLTENFIYNVHASGTPGQTVKVGIYPRNAAGLNAVSVIVATITINPVAPDAFENADWSIAGGAGSITVTINSLPNANGATITDIEYRVDGGTWTSSGGTGNFTISGLAAGNRDVEIRAVNSVGASAASFVKTAAVTAGGVSEENAAVIVIDDTTTLNTYTGNNGFTPTGGADKALIISITTINDNLAQPMDKDNTVIEYDGAAVPAGRKFAALADTSPDNFIAANVFIAIVPNPPTTAAAAISVNFKDASNNNVNQRSCFVTVREVTGVNASTPTGQSVSRASGTAQPTMALDITPANNDSWVEVATAIVNSYGPALAETGDTTEDFMGETGAGGDFTDHTYLHGHAQVVGAPSALTMGASDDPNTWFATVAVEVRP